MTTQHARAGERTIVLASTRPWSRSIVASLEKRTAYRFEFIAAPADLTLKRLSALAPEFVFFPHWSHRIPAAIYERFECVIFHMSDLPFGRGGSPLQNLIARGIYETKISAIRCVEEVDAGPIYLKRPLSLHGAAEEIFVRASDVIADMIVEILECRPQPAPQVGEPTSFKRRTAEQGDLAAAATLEQWFDMIRMLDATGYPNAFIRLGRFKIEFSRASLKAGYVLADARISRAEDEKEAKER